MFGPTDKILCLGRSGSGKSYLGRQVQRAYPRRVIFDTLNEYTAQDGHCVHSFHAFTEALQALVYEKRFCLIYKFDAEDDQQDLHFDHAIRILYYFGNLQIVIEEVHEFCSPHFLPKWLKRCLLTGRHKGISLLFTTQRPGELSKTLLSQCAHVFAGSIYEKNDVAYVQSFLGERAKELINLPERKFLYFRPGQEILLVNNSLK